MSYSIAPSSHDCYEGTGVLVNKLDIRDENILAQVEQNITGALIAKGLLEIPFENVDFDFYKMLHGYIFSDIYSWAGKIRNVNLSKKTTHFCPFHLIEEQGKAIFKRLKIEDYLCDLDRPAFIDRFTELYCDLNILHPFREGNGRTQRMFLTMLLLNAGYCMDFSRIDKDSIMIATIKSASGDVFMLKDIFEEYIG